MIGISFSAHWVAWKENTSGYSDSKGECFPLDPFCGALFSMGFLTKSLKYPPHLAWKPWLFLSQRLHSQDEDAFSCASFSWCTQVKFFISNFDNSLSMNPINQLFFVSSSSSLKFGRESRLAWLEFGKAQNSLKGSPEAPHRARKALLPNIAKTFVWLFLF